jgi:hypothetical protein
MPRFGTKWLLFVFALVALWFSTYNGYAAARDVRATISLCVFLGSGLAALYCRGKQQAFWLGFFVVMLTVGIGFPKDYVPNFNWVPVWLGHYYDPFPSDDVREAYYFTRDIIKTFTVLVLSIAMGYFAAYLYGRRQQLRPPTRSE